MSRFFLVLPVLLGATAATAAPPHRGEPPEVAFEACAAAVQNDACTVTTPRGHTLEGVCHVYETEALFCVPDREPPRPRTRDDNNAE
ncbi:MAG: hypothetical protein AAGH76_10915 [Pseudomonadota bacterium]